MAEHRSSTRPAPLAPEPRDVNINDIGQHTVNSTTTVLTAPNGTLATVHLAWVVTIDPLDDNHESFIADEYGNIGDQDRELVEDGDYVLTHGCEERDYYYVAADPTAARGYAVANAAGYLVAQVNRSGYKVDPPRSAEELATSTPDFLKPVESPGPIPNSDEKPADTKAAAKS